MFVGRRSPRSRSFGVVRLFGGISLALCLAVVGIAQLPLAADVAKSPEKTDTKDKSKPRELKAVAELTDFTNWCTSVAFSPNGKVLAVGSHNQVQLWDVATNKQSGVWNTASGYVKSLAFLPDGQQLVVGAYQSVSVWDVSRGTKSRDLPRHRGFVTSLAVSSNGKLLATGCDDELVRLIRVDDGSLVRSLDHAGDPVTGVQFSADGKWLATAIGDETRVTRPGAAKLWNAESGEFIRSFDGPTKFATGVSFAENGAKLIVTSADEKTYVFEVESGKPLGFFGAHSRPVNAIAICADGVTAITGSGGRAKGKNELIVWKIADGDVLATVDGHQATIAALSLSPDSKTVATAGYDNTVRLWDVSFASVSPLATPAATTVTSTESATTEAVAKDDASQTQANAETKPLKAGIIGLDTSHAIAFTKTLNAEKPKPEVAGCRVVAAYPKGSPDIESSTSRVPGYTEEMKKMGVEIVDSIENLAKQVDFVMLETNDGRPHFEQLLPVLKAGKPCFIDKPIAGSLTDAVAIFEAAKKYNVPIFSSSSLRFGKNTLAARGGSLGKISRCETTSPASLESTHPDLFWYGIHGVESLFTVMGTGCISVKRGLTEDGKIEVVGQWTDERVGIYREGKGYGGNAVGDKGQGPVGAYDGYDPLVIDIVKFVRTKQPPVSERETLEIYAFMEAADESKRQNGASITLESVLTKAKLEAAKKLQALR